MAENGEQIGYGRTQPEFSLGERMASMEAKLAALIDNSKERKIEQEKLFGEKIEGVEDNIDVKDKAQKEAIGKAEKAAGDQAINLADELRQSRETSDKRLGALERGGAAGPVDLEARLRIVERGETGNRSEKKAIVDLQNRQIALVGIIIAVVTALILYHP